jgi:hypothetical protein
MGLVSDVFNQNAWGAVEVQEEVVDRVDFRPNLLGQLGIFEPVYSRSTQIAITERDRKLTMIPTSALGEAPQELIPKGARVRYFTGSRLAKGSTIHAHEVAGVSALPFDLQTKEMAEEVAERFAHLLEEAELTWEHMRLGALQGKVLDADGSVIVDWYKEFDVTQAAEINFELGNPETDVRQKCRDVERKMQAKGKGAYTPSTRIVSICGDGFFDKIVGHKSIKETKLGTERAALLENIPGYSSKEIENITFINYRGADEGPLAIASDKARFFPVGARGAFKAGFTPCPEFKPYLNRKAQEYYGLLLADPSGRDAWDRAELYSYPIFICSRPEMLQRARAG